MATTEQTVRAVLDATNKRYPEEIFETDDGLGGYTRYSDGWLEQYGKITKSDSTFPITFFVEFRDAKYTLNLSYMNPDSGTYGSWAHREITNTRKTTGVTVYTNSVGNNLGFAGCWEVKGYAA